MKNLMKKIFPWGFLGCFLCSMTTLHSQNTVYENAEDENTTGWSVYSDYSGNAEITNIDDNGKRVIQLNGNHTYDGYMLGNWEGQSGDWNNTDQHILSWKLKYLETFYIYIRVTTETGTKYLVYTPYDNVPDSNDDYIYTAIGTEATNGNWQTFTRNLNDDLHNYNQNDNIVAVHAFLIRGSGLIDDIMLKDNNIPPVTNITDYEDAEDGNTDGWWVYDNYSGSATITNIDDNGNRVIQLNGDHTYDGYMLGNWENQSEEWNNTTQHILSWKMKYSEEYTIYISVTTETATKFLVYTPNTAPASNDSYIYHSIGNESIDGNWHDFTRNLNDDLHSYDPNDNIVTVHAFLIRGSGLLDDIMLKDNETATPLLDETTYENAEDGNTDGWWVYDNRSNTATITNIDDNGNRIIQLNGDHGNDGYMLGNWENQSGDWNNTTQHILTWRMKYAEAYTIYIRVTTETGTKYIIYTPYNGTSNDDYIYISLGDESKDGNWHEFTKNLNDDLHTYNPNDNIIAVHAFLIRGSGLLDNIKLLGSSNGDSESIDNMTTPVELFAANNVSLANGSFSIATYTITNGAWDYGTRVATNQAEVTLQTRIQDSSNYNYDVLFLEPNDGIDYKRGHYLFAIDMKRAGDSTDYIAEADTSEIFNNTIWLRYIKNGSSWNDLRGASFQLPYHLTTQWKTYYAYVNLDTNVTAYLMQNADTSKIGFYFEFSAHQGNYMIKNFKAWNFDSLSPLIKAQFDKVDFKTLNTTTKVIKRSTGTKTIQNRIKVDDHGNISIRKRNVDGTLANSYTPTFPYLLWTQSTATPKAKLVEYGWDIQTEWASHANAVKEASSANMLSIVVINANEMNGQEHNGAPNDISWRIIKDENLMDKLSDNEAEDIIGILLDNEKSSFRNYSLAYHKKAYEDIEEWIGQGIRIALNATPFSVEGTGGSLESTGFDFCHLHGTYIAGDGNITLLWKTNFAFGKNLFWAKTSSDITDSLGFSFKAGIWYTCEMAPEHRWNKTGNSADSDIANGIIIKSEFFEKSLIGNMPIKVFEQSNAFPGFAQIQSRSGKKFAPLVIAAIANGAKMIGTWEDFPNIQIDSNGTASVLGIERNPDGSLKTDNNDDIVTIRINYGSNWWIQTVGQYADPDIFNNGLADQLKVLKPITNRMALDGIIAADSFSKFTAWTNKPYCMAGTKQLANGTKYILFSNISANSLTNVEINSPGLSSNTTIYNYCDQNQPVAVGVRYENDKFIINNIEPYGYRIYRLED